MVMLADGKLDESTLKIVNVNAIFSFSHASRAKFPWSLPGRVRVRHAHWGALPLEFDATSAVNGTNQIK